MGPKERSGMESARSFYGAREPRQGEIGRAGPKGHGIYTPPPRLGVLLEGQVSTAKYQLHPQQLGVLRPSYRSPNPQVSPPRGRGCLQAHTSKAYSWPRETYISKFKYIFIATRSTMLTGETATSSRLSIEQRKPIFPPLFSCYHQSVPKML